MGRGKSGIQNRSATDPLALPPHSKLGKTGSFCLTCLRAAPRAPLILYTGASCCPLPSGDSGSKEESHVCLPHPTPCTSLLLNKAYFWLHKKYWSNTKQKVFMKIAQLWAQESERKLWRRQAVALKHGRQLENSIWGNKGWNAKNWYKTVNADFLSPTRLGKERELPALSYHWSSAEWERGCRKAGLESSWHRREKWVLQPPQSFVNWPGSEWGRIDLVYPRDSDEGRKGEFLIKED